MRDDLSRELLQSQCALVQYREMLKVTLTQLHEAQHALETVQARCDALREELRRYTSAQIVP